MTPLEGALRLVELGWPVFPAQLVDPSDNPVPLANATPDMKLKKVPIGTLVEHGYRDATTNVKRVKLWWRVRPDALVGVAMPKGTVALDVDEVEKFLSAGLDLPDGPGQQTLRGGYHRFFRSDGRRIRQTVKEVPGADTRVGGRGYVVAWQPEAFPPADDLPPAPEWLYDRDAPPESDEAAPPRRQTRDDVLVIRMGERDNKLTSIAGSLRKAGLGKDSIYAALKGMVASGQVEQTREDPITDKDLRRISGSIGGRQSDAVDKEARPAPERHFAKDILKNDYGELTYFVDELIPEGVGIIGGAPKVGKSWLVLQAAMEIADGSGSLLDRQVMGSQPVLYYALEDGPRRAKKRMLDLKGFHDIDVTMLEWRFDAPLLGEGLEDDIERWVTDNGGGVVLVDVLAMVQPEQRGRGSAYNADYTMLREIRNRLKRVRDKEKIAAAIAFITHVRKMGAEDPYATLQGTTGITGSTDWAWVIKRPRMEPQGTIQVNGRDIEKEPFIDAVFNGAWTAIGNLRRGGSKQRNNILDALLTEGDLTTAQVRRFINEKILGEDDTKLTNNSVNEKLNAMQAGGLVEQTDKYVNGRDGGYVWHARSEDEIAAIGAAGRAVASAVEAASGHGRAPKVRYTRGRDAPARENMGPHAPQAPQETSSNPMERVEGMEGGIPARRRPRAPAHTRSPARMVGDDMHEQAKRPDRELT